MGGDADPVGAVGGAVGGAGSPGTLGRDLAGMTEEAGQDMLTDGNLSRAIETALSSATSGPGTAPEASAFRAEVSGGAAGEVGRAKADVVSDVNGGAGPDAASDATPSPQDDLMARYERLYTDMTTFQVAWSIARRTQQDTAQLLRGS